MIFLRVLQNTSHLAGHPVEVRVTSNDPGWAEAHARWVEGKNPTDSAVWRKGVFFHLVPDEDATVQLLFWEMLLTKPDLDQLDVQEMVLMLSRFKRDHPEVRDCRHRVMNRLSKHYLSLLTHWVGMPGMQEPSISTALDADASEVARDFGDGLPTKTAQLKKLIVEVAERHRSNSNSRR